MSEPIVSAIDFGVYLGQTVDTDRATLILAKAQALCETVVSPLPDGADTVILPVAARAYGNALSMTQVGMGSAYGTFSQTGSGGVGGLYLSRSDKATLRRLSGRGGGFSVDMLQKGVSDVQAVVVAATAGTFTLAFCDVVSAPIAFDATPVVVQSALEALPGIGAGNVQVAAGFTVTFKGDLAYQSVPQLVADDSGLTGTATVVTVQQGSRPPWCA